jgi:hypothetical protein
MFQSQKSFEKSLRSSSTTYQVPIITPLKTEIHKGCTGKAHACGSIKSNTTILLTKTSNTSSLKSKAKVENKPLRKNSLSSETVSDSGSESWNSNKDSNSVNANNDLVKTSPQQLPKPLKRTQSVNYGRAVNNAIASARRRTSENILLSTDVLDNGKSPSKIQRGRLLSDGDEKVINGIEDTSRLRRSSSFRSKNIPPLIPPKPKQQTVANSTPAKQQNGNFNFGRLRNSFRGLRSQNQVANWNALWESSFSTKFGGGNFRVLDKNSLNAAAKVKKNIFMVFICFFVLC